MKAAVLHESPGELVIEDVSIDKPAANEVLVQTTNAGLCHSDLHFMDGHYSTRMPAVMGHESAGIVQAVGEDVEYVKPGDHVIACLSVFCGNCQDCLSGAPYRCRNNRAVSRPKGATPRLSKDGETYQQFARLGGFAEEMLVHQNALVKVDRDMPLDKAALIGCGVTTGMGAVFRTAAVRPGETVVVIGAGGIGLSAIQAARIAGAGMVIAVDVTDEKLETAKTVGATHGINAITVQDPVQAVKELTGGLGVDYAFEALGMKVTAEQAFHMIRPGGTATVIGMVPVGENIEIPGHELLNDKKLQGSMMGSNQFRTDMPRMVDMYLDGRLLLDEMVSQTISLDQINEGYQDMRDRKVARTVINF